RAQFDRFFGKLAKDHSFTISSDGQSAHRIQRVFEASLSPTFANIVFHGTPGIIEGSFFLTADLTLLNFHEHFLLGGGLFLPSVVAYRGYLHEAAVDVKNHRHQYFAPLVLDSFRSDLLDTQALLTSIAALAHTITRASNHTPGLFRFVANMAFVRDGLTTDELRSAFNSAQKEAFDYGLGLLRVILEPVIGMVAKNPVSTSN
ncbi:hypothetical protein HZC07_05925, partial [Candidatus Micrarchaeota archaeon]|nr:hypothetical protein [Candidatus Micrarchaeota archaeon]